MVWGKADSEQRIYSSVYADRGLTHVTPSEYMTSFGSVASVNLLLFYIDIKESLRTRLPTDCIPRCLRHHSIDSHHVCHPKSRRTVHMSIRPNANGKTQEGAARACWSGEKTTQQDLLTQSVDKLCRRLSFPQCHDPVPVVSG